MVTFLKDDGGNPLLMVDYVCPKFSGVGHLRLVANAKMTVGEKRIISVRLGSIATNLLQLKPFWIVLAERRRSVGSS